MQTPRTLAHLIPGLSAAVLVAGVASPSAARADGVTLTGTIKYAGPARPVKPPPTLKVTQDDKVCGKTQPDETVLADKAGGLANVVVSVEGVLNLAKPVGATIKLDQKGCRFLPHVQAAPTGSTIVVDNSDHVLHNVHGWRDGGTVFNLAMPTPNSPMKRKITASGVNAFRCDAGHTWMSAYVVTFDHPYFAVTDDKGHFSIADVPPGDYQIRVWHEGWVRPDATAPAVTTEVVVEKDLKVEPGLAPLTLELK